MSKARPVYPGAVVFSTRRTHRHEFLLRPSRKVNRAIEYIVAVLAKRHGILLHALCVLSNHTHDLVTDPLGRIVEFQRECHALIARVLNAMHGETDSLWSQQPTARVACRNQDEVLDHLVYSMVNPVLAGLVASGKNWPGVRGAWPRKPRTLRRPKFFRNAGQGGNWPEKVVLEFHRPPGHADLSDDDLAALLDRTIKERESAARAGLRAAGNHFLGRRRILAQSRHDSPAGVARKKGARPKLRPWKWARLERQQRDRRWLQSYKAASSGWLAGKRGVVFPFGTWKMRVVYRLPCDTGPPQMPVGIAA